VTRVVVTFPLSGSERAALDEELAGLASVAELGDSGRSDLLSSADVILAQGIGRELESEDDYAALHSVRLIQLVSAGVDHVPFHRLPDGVPVASNAGAYSEPIAEHVVAMALALAKRLPAQQAAMRRGVFDQETPNRMIAGSLVGVLGFGGIGQASARLFRALGARVHAVNRSGSTDEPVDAASSLSDLAAVLAAVDVLVISIPLTRATRGLIGARELGLMQPDAILVNVARAAIIDEDALYEHLRANPAFSAGIDTWWQEPRDGSSFAPRHPFLDLPNVIGSPHNSGITAEAMASAVRQAGANIARCLRGEPVRNLVDLSDYVE
jgi:glycerate dehydrogenase